MVLVATIAVGAVVALVALAAALILGALPKDASWTPVLQNVLTTSYQALAVGALGGLAKLLLDRRKSRDQAATELRDRRYRFIATVVRASHNLDNGRMVIMANRSVKSWTEVINTAVIPARTETRQLTHELRNWSEAGQPVFDDTERIAAQLEFTYKYLGDLIEEYADHKQASAEMQLPAEGELAKQRQTRLASLWNDMTQLPMLGDLIANGPTHAEYRAHYLDALRTMRISLKAEKSHPL